MIKFIRRIMAIACLFTPLSTIAQKPDADLLLKQALTEKNVHSNYPNAIRIAKQGLAVSPDYLDIRLLLARLYVLTDSLDQARNELTTVLRMSPQSIDALQQLTRLEASQQNFDAALIYNAQILSLYPDSAGFRVDRISLLRESNEPGKAYDLAKKLRAEFPLNEAYAAAARELFIETRKNRIALTYSNTYFERSGKDPWNLVSAYYGREEKFATLIARVNYADRAYDQGLQFELEAYPKHRAGDYSFINLAYSNAAIFPKFRFAYSYLASLPRAWEAELGFRYQYNNEGILSYTGSVGKYIGNYWFNFRTFLTPTDERISQSYTFTTRLYQNSADDYFTFIAGTGISPDDRSRNFQISERLNLKSGRVSLGYQRLVWERNVIGALVTLNNEEYTPGKRENEFDFMLSFLHRF